MSALSLVAILAGAIGILWQWRQAEEARRRETQQLRRAEAALARSSLSLAEADGLAQPVAGYVGYDHIARLEPTVPLPADGPDFPESRFVVAETLVRFDHVASVAEVLAGTVPFCRPGDAEAR